MVNILIILLFLFNIQINLWGQLRPKAGDIDTDTQIERIEEDISLMAYSLKSLEKFILSDKNFLGHTFIKGKNRGGHTDKAGLSGIYKLDFSDEKYMIKQDKALADKREYMATKILYYFDNNIAPRIKLIRAKNQKYPYLDLNCLMVMKI